MIVKIILKDGISIIDNALSFIRDKKEISMLFGDMKYSEIDIKDIISYTIYTDTGSVIEDTELVL